MSGRENWHKNAGQGTNKNTEICFYPHEIKQIKYGTHFLSYFFSIYIPTSLNAKALSETVENQSLKSVKIYFTNNSNITFKIIQYKPKLHVTHSYWSQT